MCKLTVFNEKVKGGAMHSEIYWYSLLGREKEIASSSPSLYKSRVSNRPLAGPCIRPCPCWTLYTPLFLVDPVYAPVLAGPFIRPCPCWTLYNPLSLLDPVYAPVLAGPCIRPCPCWTLYTLLFLSVVKYRNKV